MREFFIAFLIYFVWSILNIQSAKFLELFFSFDLCLVDETFSLKKIRLAFRTFLYCGNWNRQFVVAADLNRRTQRLSTIKTNCRTFKLKSWLWIIFKDLIFCIPIAYRWISVIPVEHRIPIVSSPILVYMSYAFAQALRQKQKINERMNFEDLNVVLKYLTTRTKNSRNSKTQSWQ